MADNIATSRRLLEEAFSQGNLDVLDEVTADAFVDHDPVMGDQDKDAAKRTIASYRESFPDLSFEIEDIFEAGDKVVTRWSGNGTFENEFMGQEPTHERGDPVKGINIDRYDADGKVVESWAQWDVMTLMRNVGLAPSGAEAPSPA
jgi:predicted ester cyclase